MKNTVKANCLVMIIIAVLGMVGCGQKNYADIYSEVGSEADVMLVNFFRKTVGTEEEAGSFEMVLSTADSGEKARLDVYRKDAGQDDETCVSYLVPCEAVERCYEVIYKHKMHKWNDMKDAVSMDGVMAVCKFRHGDTYIRATTDAMPENGEEALDEVRKIMSGYAIDEYLINE